MNNACNISSKVVWVLAILALLGAYFLLSKPKQNIVKESRENFSENSVFVDDGKNDRYIKIKNAREPLKVEPIPEFSYYPNIVEQWSRVQGVRTPGDGKWRPRRHLGFKYALLENGSKEDVHFYIAETSEKPDSPKISILQAQSSIDLGINPWHKPDQWIHFYSPEGEHIRSQLLWRPANQYIIRKGVDGWFVQYFTKGNASH